MLADADMADPRGVGAACVISSLIRYGRRACILVLIDVVLNAQRSERALRAL